jgi:hypothetical protein
MPDDDVRAPVTERNLNGAREPPLCAADWSVPAAPWQAQMWVIGALKVAVA